MLTAGTTFSVGETFAQALIDRLGGTIRIGEPTQGVFSDTLDRVLPNGMALWLPNEEFLTRSGRTLALIHRRGSGNDLLTDFEPVSARRLDMGGL